MLLSQDLVSRLRRRTLRKGFAFPAAIGIESSEATPRQIRGVASKEKIVGPESRRLSAMCGGKAAIPSLLTALFLSTLITMPAFGQTPTSSPLAAKPDNQVPAIAVDFRADTRRPMPSLNRIGVDPADQQPLTLREAITLALRNNKDIEIARDTVKMAEFDLLTARGSYDPRFSAQSYFEKIKTPATNVLSGAAKVITDDLTATARLEGLAPKGGGSYHVDFSSIRATSNSTFNVLNPSYPTALTFSYVQPLVRGLRFDLPRRQIEVAKKNLSLTDAQFRQRAIEVITSVQRSY